MAGENEFLLHALLMGIFITFLYDLLRIFRRVLPHGSLAVSLEDICFWIYCAARVFLLMYHEGNGTLRWFAVLGALSGMLLYKKLVSRFLVKWMSFGLQKIIGILIFPFRTVGNTATKAAHKLRLRIVRRGGRIGRQLKKRLTFFLKVLKISLWRT